MKKTIFAVILAAAAMNINAQLVVDSIGRVGVGTETPMSLLSVGGEGLTRSIISCRSEDKMYGIDVRNYTESQNATYGGRFYAMNSDGDCFGVSSEVLGAGNVSPLRSIAVKGTAGDAYISVGIFGGRSMSGEVPTNYAGVFGSEGSFTTNFSGYSGTYAGFFNGKVRVTNGIYATVLSPSASPSPSGQNGTTILSDRGESVTDKLSQVQALQFLRYNPTQEANTSRASLEDVDTDNMSPEELDSLAEAIGDIEPERYLSPVQYGLNADQLKEVYPELVYEDANGNVSINYVEMIPLLVQSINELKSELAELKGASPRTAKAPTDATAIEETVADVDMVRMDQNKPNPFSESTVITLNIPSNTQVANIFIYDMSGKQVQSLPVSERGETNITVYASDLAAGMYIYTLIVDGKVAVTRRMIVTI